jgi:hypothetical protein
MIKPGDVPGSRRSPISGINRTCYVGDRQRPGQGQVIEIRMLARDVYLIEQAVHIRDRRTQPRASNSLGGKPRAPIRNRR